MSFGERLKQLRIKNKMTQSELALQINNFFHTKYNKTSISRFETGVTKPDATALQNFAQYFDVSMDYMSGLGEIGIDSDLDEIMEMREALRENPDIKVLFSLSTKAKPQHIEAVISLLKLLKGSNSNE